MSLLRFLKKSSESSPLLPTPQNSAKQAANDEVKTLVETKQKRGTYQVYSDEVRAKKAGMLLKMVLKPQ